MLVWSLDTRSGRDELVGDDGRPGLGRLAPASAERTVPVDLDLRCRFDREWREQAPYPHRDCADAAANVEARVDSEIGRPRPVRVGGHDRVVLAEQDRVLVDLLARDAPRLERDGGRVEVVVDDVVEA